MSAPELQGEALPSLVVTVLERTPNGVLVTDPQGRVRLVNRALATMIPVVPRPVGRMPLEAVPVKVLADALSQASPSEQEISHRIGTRDLLIRVVDLGPGHGRLAIVQDVTRIRQADRYRREFVANVSHELRTPATAIAGYAETLLADRERLPPDVVRMVETIHRNGLRLTELFDDLLQLARLDATDEPPPLSPVGLTSAVAESIDKLSALAESRQVKVRSTVPEDLDAYANRDALGHIIANLVSNAIKYSHEGGKVLIQGRPGDKCVLLEVIDEGIGIDTAHHDRIFQRFYRVDKGRTRTQGGTGLGLAIVKHLSKAMKARIEVRSRKGRGSTFRLRLREVPHSETPEAD